MNTLHWGEWTRGWQGWRLRHTEAGGNPAEMTMMGTEGVGTEVMEVRGWERYYCKLLGR